MEGNEQPKQPDQQPQGADGDDAISSLRKQLYAKEESVELQKRQQELSTPPPIKRRALAMTEKPNLIDVVAQRSRKRRRALRIAGFIILLVAVLAGAAVATFWYRGTQQVVDNQVHLSMSVPGDVIAGQTTTYTIEYRNDSRVRWDFVELLVDLPGGMRVTSVQPELEQTGRQQYTLRVGSLAAGDSGTITISGQLVGEQGASLIARSRISFTPENFPSGSFDRSESATTTIASVPLDISIEAPNSAAEGERVPMIVRVRNNGSESFAAGKLELEVAPGVQLAVEDAAFSGGFSTIAGSWDLPVLEPLAEVERTAVLFLEGAPGERRVLTMRALVHQDNEDFVLRTVDQVFTIAASELALEQTFNDSTEDLVVRAGETVKAKVAYKNTGTTALSNAVVTVRFEGAVLDASQIDLQSGAYDPTTRTITWRSSSVPGLATIQPQQEGEITYEFAILPIDELPTDESAKNQNLIVAATIDSPNLPASGDERRVISNRRVLSVLTDLTLAADAFYDDGRLGITSTGPTPPEVGQTTTYTARLRLGSTLNDAGDIEVRAVLPDGVTYTDNVYKTVGEVEFNDRTNEILWIIPLVDGLAGRAGPGPELHVQVAITPGENVRGESLLLLQSARVTGVDLFVDQSVETVVPNDDLPSTEDAVPGAGKVE